MSGQLGIKHSHNRPDNCAMAACTKAGPNPPKPKPPIW